MNLLNIINNSKINEILFKITYKENDILNTEYVSNDDYIKIFNQCLKFKETLKHFKTETILFDFNYKNKDFMIEIDNRYNIVNTTDFKNELDLNAKQLNCYSVYINQIAKQLIK